MKLVKAVMKIYILVNLVVRIWVGIRERTLASLFSPDEGLVLFGDFESEGLVEADGDFVVFVDSEARLFPALLRQGL